MAVVQINRVINLSPFVHYKWASIPVHLRGVGCLSVFAIPSRSIPIISNQIKKPLPALVRESTGVHHPYEVRRPRVASHLGMPEIIASTSEPTSEYNKANHSQIRGSVVENQDENAPALGFGASAIVQHSNKEVLPVRTRFVDTSGPVKVLLE
ncbi:hypothetical protein PYCCODRAFT_974066 [Trametes coccinea BRFM310]|uniref:Uncharacterized protein n=1 Tax=Trametes coccinea (strain BRFM310) TaxID=1353009 RepID=A0A1Y2IBV6_TRAC3|nr:hypothetical protein PYCCODRAFT_974066 [Trametes coccinea BRFM310]